MSKTKTRASEKKETAATAATATPVVIDFFALLNGAEAMINALLTKGRNADGYDAACPYFDAADSLIKPLAQFRLYVCDLSLELITPRRMHTLEKHYAALLDAMLLADNIVPIDVAIRRRPVNIMALFDAIAAAADTPANRKAIAALRTALYKATYRGWQDYTRKAPAVLAALDSLEPAPLSVPTGQGQEQQTTKRKPTIKQLTFI